MTQSVEATLLILLVIVVFGPIVAERLRVPGIIGLIFGGVLVGPFALGWVEADSLIADLGAVGILFLMFLAGLGFNFKAFKRNRNAAVVYGLLGFAVPFGISLWIGMGLLGYGLSTAALIGAMWSSNTLVALPEVTAAGLQDDPAVSAAIAAGVEFDLMSLTVLAVATSSTVLGIESVPEAAPVPGSPLPPWLVVPVLVGFTLWLLPKIAAWFFVEVGRTRMQRFVFALAAMAAGATVAMLGGIEGLIGAFLAGLGLNTMIPIHGPLMDRLDFVGSVIFVPAFLVSIGLSIDPALLFDLRTVTLALVFAGIVVVGKSAAAAMTGRIFRFSADESGLMASLSFGQAASTLAIAEIGVSLGILTEQVVNAAVLTIVATALITSFATRFFARRVPRPSPSEASVGEHVLVDVRPHGSDLETLLALARGIAHPDDGVVVPYAVPEPGERDAARVRVDEAVRAASSIGLDPGGVVRVDESFTSGTLNLIEQNDATLVILSWRGIRFPSDYVFGNDIDGVGEASPVPSLAARVLRPWDRVVVVTGDVKSGWHREDASLAIDAARRIGRSARTPLVAVGVEREFLEDRLDGIEDVEITATNDPRGVAMEIFEPDDLVLFPAYVLRDAPIGVRRRLARLLARSNIGVVAGPRRLSVSKSVTRWNRHSVVASRA